MEYPRLFEPVRIGKVWMKNRIAMAPMGIVGLTTPEGHPTQRAIDYYIERAKGGLGLIITSLFKVDNTIEVNHGRIELITREAKAPLGELCDVVHSLGTKIFIQLTAGFGRVSRVDRIVGRPVSASAIANVWDPNLTCRALKTEEVEKMVQCFGEAAEIAAIAGMDGIELHGHEGYIFDQFTTAIWNRRTDKYGGDLRGRLTFPIEVLKEIKKRLGEDYPVQYRVGLKHYIKGPNSGALKGEEFVEAGRDIEEGLEMVRILEEAGFDALHVDAGCYDSWYWAHPPSYQDFGCMVDMAEKAKAVVNIPVIAVGRLEVPELAEAVIREGKADMIALGRGLLADAYWPLKVRQERTDEIRPCIGCHGCFARFQAGRPMSCAVNPTCGRETLYPVTPSSKPEKVMIVGGGVAGMEAARVAALRGHEVTLYEKDKTLGGHLIEASVPGFKKDLRRLGSWYRIQMENLGIEIAFETEADMELVEEKSPDVLILANGSHPIVPDLPGIAGENVCTCVDLLLGKREAGTRNVVVGGGFVGCETALWLAQQGKDVTIVEMMPELIRGGVSVPQMNRAMLLDLLAFHGVRIMTGTSMQEVTDFGMVTVDRAFQRGIQEADRIILALGMAPNQAFYEEALGGSVPRVFAVGDCREIRNVYGAVWDGFEVGRNL